MSTQIRELAGEALNASDYQQQAARTLITGDGVVQTGSDLMLVWTALGLTGEAGEVAELVKKGILHGHGLDPARLEKELGDVLWYVAGLATIAGLSMDLIMERNIAKLRERYPDGFTSADSIERRDI